MSLELTIAVRVRVGGHTFEDDSGGAQRQRPVHRVRVARDPATVRDTGKHITVLSRRAMQGGDACEQVINSEVVIVIVIVIVMVCMCK